MLNTNSCLDKSCTDKSCSDKSCVDKSCSDKSCSDKSCSDKSCTDKSCNNKTCDYQRYFKKPKSYSAIVNEHRDLMSDHLDMIKQLESSNKLIESLRTLNTTIIERLKDTGHHLTDAEQKLEVANQQLIKSEEQKQLFIRTYTNMSIQMLKLEEKVAKYEGRVF